MASTYGSSKRIAGWVLGLLLVVGCATDTDSGTGHDTQAGAQTPSQVFGVRADADAAVKSLNPVWIVPAPGDGSGTLSEADYWRLFRSTELLAGASYGASIGGRQANIHIDVLADATVLGSLSGELVSGRFAQIGTIAPAVVQWLDSARRTAYASGAGTESPAACPKSPFTGILVMLNAYNPGNNGTNLDGTAFFERDYKIASRQCSTVVQGSASAAQALENFFGALLRHWLN